MSRLLILGASTLQLPAILKAKEMGHYVAVADYNPQAIGILFADEFFPASTIDIEAICQVAKTFHPDGIMTLATDMPMRSLAAVAEKFGLPGISVQTALRCTDKGEMIRAFKADGVASPWYHIVENESVLKSIISELSFPCIIKPTDNAGSRGVILVHAVEELSRAYRYSREQSRHGTVIIEEYMQGPEVSVEVMTVDGIPHILAVTDKLTTGAPYFVEMGHSQPSRLSKTTIDTIKDLAVKAIRSVGINMGPAHVEMIVTAQGPKMVELGARMGGDCITTHLVPLSTGIDMVKATIDISLGLYPDIEPKFEQGSAIRYFQVCPGKIYSIEGINAARKIAGICDIICTKKIGDLVTDIHSSIDRMGCVIAQRGDAAAAIEACEQVMKQIKIEIYEEKSGK